MNLIFWRTRRRRASRSEPRWLRAGWLVTLTKLISGKYAGFQLWVLRSVRNWEKRTSQSARRRHLVVGMAILTLLWLVRVIYLLRQPPPAPVPSAIASLWMSPTPSVEAATVKRTPVGTGPKQAPRLNAVDSSYQQARKMYQQSKLQKP